MYHTRTRFLGPFMRIISTLNGEPAPDKSLKDQSLLDRQGNAFPIIAIEFVASGVMDTLMLPYTIYRQNKDGSIEIFR